MYNQEIIARIAVEMQAGDLDAALWTRALAESGGDDAKTRANYIRLRHAALQLYANRRPAAEELAVLRGELGGLFADRGIRSLYAILGVAPDAGDAAIGLACELARSRLAALPDGKLRAELAYALETLADPAAREAYDRGFHARLSRSAAPAGATAAAGAAGGSTRRTAAVLATVLLLGGAYLATRFWVDRDRHAVAREALAVEREAVERAAAIEAEIARNQRLVTEGVLEDQARTAARAADYSARQQDYQRVAAERAAVREYDQRVRSDARNADAEARRRAADEQREEAEARRRVEEIRRNGFNRALATRDFGYARQLAGNPSEVAYVDAAERRALELEQRQAAMR